jgi:hypothetical protein
MYYRNPNPQYLGKTNLLGSPFSKKRMVKYLGVSTTNQIVSITQSEKCLAKSIRVLFFGNI